MVGGMKEEGGLRWGSSFSPMDDGSLTPAVSRGVNYCGT
jgi:hypothetical protein